MAAIQEGKVHFVLLSSNSLFSHFFTNKIHLNSERLFEACFTKDVLIISSVNLPEKNEVDPCLEDEKKTAPSQVILHSLV